MIRLRHVFDDIQPVNRDAIVQVQNIIRTQFPGVDEAQVLKLPDQLHNPLKYRFRCILLVVEGSRGIVKGFALLLHAPDLDFCFLDFISASRFMTGRGIGSILYERVREEAFNLGKSGLFYECLPDDPALCSDPAVLKANRARLRFYERFGAFPVSNTAYETPVGADAENPPYLVIDRLGRDTVLHPDRVKPIVRAILERKYAGVCSPGYIRRVVESFRDDPVSLRAPRYTRQVVPVPVRAVAVTDAAIALAVSEHHEIHHVHERGYVEAPARISSILGGLMDTGLFRRLPVKRFREQYIRAVHDGGFVTYMREVCKNVPPNKSVYPYVFPIRNNTRPPQDLPIRAGYYCIDTFTPLNRNAYLAAREAVNCALTAASSLVNDGHRQAYALVRPPGHHAEKKTFGGFCYFNSTAVAAQFLSGYGRVCILDVDYHHGNGQQNIFYERADVLTVSIHGHPRFAYPYFSGFAEERGNGPGKGYNRNYPLPEARDGEQYRETLKQALQRIRRFAPAYLVVALGLDTGKGDPTGTWSLREKDFRLNGGMIGELNLPTLVVQEGGYRIRTLGANARGFFSGLSGALHPAGGV